MKPFVMYHVFINPILIQKMGHPVDPHLYTLVPVLVAEKFQYRVCALNPVLNIHTLALVHDMLKLAHSPPRPEGR